MLVNCITAQETVWFFQAYCTYPLVYHCLQYIVASYQDKLAGVVERTQSVKVLAHVTAALGLLRVAVSEYRSGIIELTAPLLLSLGWLMRADLTPDDLQPEPVLLFKPHVRNLHNASVFGRGKRSQIATVHKTAVNELFATIDNDPLRLQNLAYAKLCAG
jgi:hypothetical protein